MGTSGRVISFGLGVYSFLLYMYMYLGIIMGTSRKNNMVTCFSNLKDVNIWFIVILGKKKSIYRL